MNQKISYKNYFGFSFEDFLQDDFFISSITNPTAESSAYWDRFRESAPGNLDDFDAAKKYIESTEIYRQTLSSKEIGEMWQHIQRGKTGAKRNIKRLIYSGVGVAACIALLFLFPDPAPKTVDESGAGDDIASFADRYTKPTVKSNEIQLMLSENKTIAVDQKESVISYDSTNIKIDAEQISTNESSEYNQLIVPLGKRSVLTLLDGTKVWINSDTRLVYPVAFVKDKREIYVDGEIFIDVMPDAARPFIVKTKDIEVRVTGTKFNVMAYDSDREKKIVLVSGSVNITSKTDRAETRLTPNLMYNYVDGQSRVEEVNTKKYTSWTEGVYYYESERLEIILQRLSRYYGEEITCDKKAAGMKCSGKLDLKDNLYDVLNGITYTIPVSVTGRDDKYAIQCK